VKAGGVVLNVPLVEGSSTTEIIRKVLDRFENEPAARKLEE
jgi:bifunctional ADP-heptose synthase (sugar kinase/adenylyltransferase)